MTFHLRNERWLVRVQKRPKADGSPGDTFTGTTHNDGLQSLWAVHVLDSPTNEVRYASVLDTIHWLAPMDELATLPKSR